MDGSATSLNSLHLLQAVFCANCEVISDSPGDTCAVCGSPSLLSLSRVLGGSLGDQRTALVDAASLRPVLLVSHHPVKPHALGPERLEKSGS